MFLESETLDAIPRSNNPRIVEPHYESRGITKPSTSLRKLIKSLDLSKHPEGGYFKQTDKSPLIMENPYYPGDNSGVSTDIETGDKKPLSPTRSFSTLIHYLITCDAPLGRFHKNKSRIIHILQRGRGQYVLIYPDGRIKTFIVGFDTEKGEVDQWVVPGGVYKASFLLPKDPIKGESDEDHLLISEVVVPGFEFEDHKFMPNEECLKRLVKDERKAEEMRWLLGVMR
ncbi:hypothetical protein FOA43_001774 [Brettanomyces nanus]|uniref:DUF985 domain-containing protein n=1 Tax=Eeniella nana TaxID=13502 RepID=A0A875S292_EENNA|nr:uncharacterized protein FOA43_001774 [Brettanomyces nanus]QPG74445.1 hypothetical protein FOA43_001774 [Brettanomyces nanus]